MDYNTILSLLKMDLQISVSAYDTLLQSYINAAETAITIEGITLNPSDEADMLLVMQYAAWMYRHRNEDAKLSKMIRWQLNNRLMAEKAGE